MKHKRGHRLRVLCAIFYDYEVCVTFSGLTWQMRSPPFLCFSLFIWVTFVLDYDTTRTPRGKKKETRNRGLACASDGDQERSTRRR